jgi:hypothetical protein
VNLRVGESKSQIFGRSSDHEKPWVHCNPLVTCTPLYHTFCWIYKTIYASSTIRTDRWAICSDSYFGLQGAIPRG